MSNEVNKYVTCLLFYQGGFLQKLLEIHGLEYTFRCFQKDYALLNEYLVLSE